MTNLTKDQQYLGRDEVPFKLDIIGADGDYLITKNGERYLDLVMGWCVGNIGWNRDEVVEAIHDFAGPTYVLPKFLYEPWVELAELLAQITPGRLTKTFRATGGTEAVEIALQAAMHYTKREQFVSIEGSYHGHSIGAMSVGSSEYRNRFSNLLPHCYKINLPLDVIAAAEVEKLLATGKIAAFIAEPIICNLGVEIPTQEFWERVQKACRATGTVLIADEVATGFGRTGKMFACEHFGLEPDIMTLGKGLTGGYAALGATIMTPELAQAMNFDSSYYSTFGWQPLNTVVTLANLRALLHQRHELFDHINQLSEYFLNRLNQLDFGCETVFRVKGLAIALVFSRPDVAQKIADRALHHELYLSVMDTDKITLFPSLTMDLSTAKEAMDLFEETVRELKLS